MRCAELQIQLTEAVASLAAQKELVAKLEHDLSTIQALSAVPRPEAEVPRPWAASELAQGSEHPQGAGDSAHLLLGSVLGGEQR